MVISVLTTYGQKRVWCGLHAEEVADRTFVMAIDSTTPTNDKLYIDVTITASGTDVATERLSVELYNQSGSAVVGQHYNDGISQLVRFDPTTLPSGTRCGGQSDPTQCA